MQADRDPATVLADADQKLAHGMPHPKCELDFRNPWHLLIATILSAQARDSVINEITPTLFQRWPGPAELAAASVDEIGEVIRRSGYWRVKAKAIQECAQAIVDRHAGQVPADHEALIALPGASHKTANLVLGVAFGIASGIVVDTHVARVAERLGVTRETRPEAIEAVLVKLVPQDRWIDFSHRFILHGRHVCTATSPDCHQCPLAESCPSREREPIGDWQTRSEREGRLAAARGDETLAGVDDSDADERPRYEAIRTPPAPAITTAPPTTAPSKPAATPARAPATPPSMRRDEDDF